MRRYILIILVGLGVVNLAFTNFWLRSATLILSLTLTFFILRKFLDDLKNSRQAMDRFQLSAGMLHDFNNLMQIAVSSLELLQRRNPHLNTNPFFIKLSRSLSMMTNLLRAQQEGARKKDVECECDMRAMIDEVLLLEDHQLRKCEIGIDINVPENFQVIVAKNLLFLVILNLLKNARESLEMSDQAEKAIWLKVWHDQSHWFLSVTDNGPGVPADFRAKLFMYGETTKLEGHGFGISSCQQAVEMHQGHLRFEVPFSHDQGARFVLSMPLLKLDSQLTEDNIRMNG
jgi:signal transduction histidine kinase